MTFLAMIIALALLQLWGSGERVQRDAWFARWRSRLSTWGVGATGRLLLAVLAPVVVAQALLNALQHSFFGLPWIGLAVVLLLYALGRGNFQQLQQRYQLQCRRGDFEDALRAMLSETGEAPSEDAPVAPEAVHDWVQRCLFYEAYQRWFAVLFFFVLLGPAGALGYRLLQLCRADFESEVAERCLLWVDWVPARLLAATFSLVGDFVHSREPLFTAASEPRGVPAHFLYTVGIAALGPQATDAADQPLTERAAAQSEDAGSLISRSSGCWVAVISLLVLLV